MTQIEQIRQEIERLKKHYLDCEEYDCGWNNALEAIHTFLDNIEEPVSEDLEEAAKKFVGYDMDCDELRDYEIGIATFKAGA